MGGVFRRGKAHILEWLACREGMGQVRGAGAYVLVGHRAHVGHSEQQGEAQQ